MKTVISISAIQTPDKLSSSKSSGTTSVNSLLERSKQLEKDIHTAYTSCDEDIFYSMKNAYEKIHSCTVFLSNAVK